MIKWKYFTDFFFLSNNTAHFKPWQSQLCSSICLYFSDCLVNLVGEISKLFFMRMGSLTWSPNPKLEDRGTSLCPVPHSKPLQYRQTCRWLGSCWYGFQVHWCMHTTLPGKICLQQEVGNTKGDFYWFTYFIVGQSATRGFQRLHAAWGTTRWPVPQGIFTARERMDWQVPEQKARSFEPTGYIKFLQIQFQYWVQLRYANIQQFIYC